MFFLVSVVQVLQKLLLLLDQNLNNKWGLFQRYVRVDNDNPIDKNVTNLTFGVNYQYTPSLTFSLSYDDVKYEGIGKEDDQLVRFQTQLTF